MIGVREQVVEHIDRVPLSLMSSIDYTLARPFWLPRHERSHGLDASVRVSRVKMCEEDHLIQITSALPPCPSVS